MHAVKFQFQSSIAFVRKTIFQIRTNTSNYLLQVDALAIREAFEDHKHVRDPATIQRILGEGEIAFRQRMHDMPYINPMSPGGTKFERNTPPPPSVLAMLPIEKEWQKELTDWANDCPNYQAYLRDCQAKGVQPHH